MNDDFLFTLPDSVLQPEQVLWLHVLAQAIIDASAVKADIRLEVADWVKTEDFEVVCGMAGVNHAHISYAIIAILGDKNHRRAFKKAMEYRFLFRTYIESHTGWVDRKREA